MENMKKYYTGSICSEEKAARIYDKICIRNLGLRARTNFEYRRKDLLKIVDEIMKEMNDCNEKI